MNTRQVFDRIAPGWYDFRHWSIFRSELEEMAKRWQRGRLLNIGCAHGPDFLPFREGFELHGIDLSREMLVLGGKYAKKFEFSPDLVQADACRLPYADNTFDYAIAVASYHHIAGSEERLAALEELKRVLKPGGEAFITVWNRWQKRFRGSGRETTVTWKTGDDVLERYYYLFTYPEINRLVKKAGFRLLSSSAEKSYRCPVKYFSRNICLLVEKTTR